MAPARSFLTARWEHLVLLSYPCPSDLLAPVVPSGTELDAWQGETLVSLVGFMFVDTGLMGIPIPFHRTFEEVNLPFYVRRRGVDGTLRRAVVFIRELVPRWAIAAIAKWTYNEPYLAVPMSHTSTLSADHGGAVSYDWRHAGASFALQAQASGPARPLIPPPASAFVAVGSEVSVHPGRRVA